ncbi:tyrosine-type recombinase/integrase [Oceanirhabdus seepicola]|uniref:Tyrosine-type recombinase/integrase n=1 Tax=Oceanirhabdus seepicola TaxID=2828781 RepID=A0A9J6P3B0_9CLOT|nr:tyrosine-type recombinase/integrase [Oceanirhabdus seepicola]
MAVTESLIKTGGSIIKFNKHFIEHFLEIKRRNSEYTSISYERDIKDFFNVEVITEITLDDIINVNIFHVEAYMLDLHNQGKSSATINRKISALSSLYKWLLKYQDNRTGVSIIKYNPFGSLKDEKPKVNNKETEFLTLEESKRLIESIDDRTILGMRNKAILSLAITTALRKSEIINIKFKDIKKIHGYDVIEVIRKGNKKDIVKIQANVLNLITTYINNTNRSFENNENDYLFIGHSRNGKNKKKLDPSTLNYMIKKCCERAGINKKIKVHSTRHTAITLAITSGASIEKVRDFAAHKNIATTNRYVHSIDKLKDNAGDLIDLFD